MADYLILVRTDPSHNPQGHMIIYAASSETESGAVEAVARQLPLKWRVEKLIGSAEAGLSELLKLSAGEVKQLTAS